MATYAGRYDEILLRKAGNRLAPPVANTTVLVYESDGTTTATLYTDRTKATAADNPVEVDASGNLEFFAEPGTYVLSIRESGSQVATNTVTVAADAAESAAASHTHTGTYQPLDPVLTATTASFTVADETKLDGIEAGATADQTAAEIVSKFTGTPDGTQYLRDDGSLATPAGGGGGGATNLTWTAATSTVASDTGTDAVITAVDASNPGLMTVAQKTKLDGIETAATADQTAAEILTAIKTVDGAGSGLDADTVDGVQAAALAPLASPTFTGTPAAPTAAAGTNTTQLATTAYVENATSAAVNDGDAAGGVLSGTYPNPGFAADMATQAELDAVKGRAVPLRVTFDGGGVALTTGAKKAYLSVPFAGTISRWRLLADVSGSIVIDVWKDTYANYPPTVADTITASAKPTISAATKAESTTLTGWTTTITAGDILEFNIDSAATVTKVILELWVTPT